MKKEEQSFGCGISVSQKGHALSGWILRFVPLFAMLFATVVAKAAGDGTGRVVFCYGKLQGTQRWIVWHGLAAFDETALQEDCMAES